MYLDKNSLNSCGEIYIVNNMEGLLAMLSFRE